MKKSITSDVQRLLDEKLQEENESDKGKLRDARRKLLARLQDQAHNPLEKEVAHVLNPQASASDILKLVVAVDKLNNILKVWQD